MNESIISVRYTKALFEAAKEINVIEAVKEDIDTIFNVMNESQELQFVFKNPVLKPSKKQEVIQQIFKNFNQLTLSFINLLIKNRREVYLHDISRNFLVKYAKSKGIEAAVFTTTKSIGNDILNEVKNIIKSVLNTNIDIRQAG